MHQDFDFVHEMNDTTLFGQVKSPSLSDYDRDNFDEAESYILDLLDRWGDLRTPYRLNDQPPVMAGLEHAI